MTDKEILTKMEWHLQRAASWAHPDDMKFCIPSTLEAVEVGNVGLALERWQDLQRKPENFDN